METVTEFHPVQTNTMPLGMKMRNLMWGIVNSTLFRFTPPMLRIFKLWRVALLRMFGAKVCWDCYLHPSCKVEYPWNLEMGAFSSLGEKSWVYALDKITIGTKCCIGKEVSLLTGTHDVSSATFALVTKPVSVGDCTWVATRSTVLPGVCIGAFCVVGANSVVTKNVEDECVVGGNPARFLKKRTINAE